MIEILDSLQSELYRAISNGASGLGAPLRMALVLSAIAVMSIATQLIDTTSQLPAQVRRPCTYV